MPKVKVNCSECGYKHSAKTLYERNYDSKQFVRVGIYGLCKANNRMIVELDQHSNIKQNEVVQAASDIIAKKFDEYFGDLRKNKSTSQEYDKTPIKPKVRVLTDKRHVESVKKIENIETKPELSIDSFKSSYEESRSKKVSHKRLGEICAEMGVELDKTPKQYTKSVLKGKINRKYKELVVL